MCNTGSKCSLQILSKKNTGFVGDNFLTNGGRVIAVTSLSENYKDAVKSSYDQIKKISFDQAYFRQDIGFDL